MNSNKIIPITTETTSTDDDVILELSNSAMNDKHTAAIKLLLKDNESFQTDNNNQINNNFDYDISKKTKIVFILMPKWAQFLPPYGIARLSSVCKASGYETHAFDYNIETYWKVKDLEDSLYGEAGENDFKWLNNEYENRVETILNPYINNWVEDIVALNPTVVGFSLYYTNVFPSIRMAKLLKEKLPNVKIIVGGSQINSKWDSGIYENVDHALRGEGEELILEFLDKIENNVPVKEYLLEADSSRRVNIDKLPFPDYSDFKIGSYVLKNAISTEISRGCVAKCTFCDETFFWKFRSRESGGIIEEIEHQYKNYNTRNVLFLDSLINGNLKELHEFAKEVIRRDLHFKWQGYSRADKRMDYAFFQDLKNSGCTSLNYGVESGSQRVLDSMKKNITPETIENNIKDGNRAGLANLTQWMLGYPNERIVDIAKTFTLIWRIHWYNLQWISRTSCMLGANTRLLANLDKYNIAKDFTSDNQETLKQFLQQWYTIDFENTKLHRLIRYKSINILCLELPKYKHNEDKYKFTHFASQYSVHYNHPVTPESIIENYQDLEYEEFDYEVIKDPSLTSNFKKTLVNEIFGLIRTLWRAHKKQGMEFQIKFDPAWDLNEYGEVLADKCFSAEYHFKINDIGEWILSARVDLNMLENPYHPWSMQPNDFQDYNINLNYSGSGTWH